MRRKLMVIEVCVFTILTSGVGCKGGITPPPTIVEGEPEIRLGDRAPLPTIDVIQNILYIDASGAVTGPVSFDYDTQGRLVGITADGGNEPGTARVTYQDGGAHVDILPIGGQSISVEWLFDAAGRIIRVDANPDKKFNGPVRLMMDYVGESNLLAESQLFPDIDENGALDDADMMSPFLAASFIYDEQGLIRQASWMMTPPAGMDAPDINKRSVSSFDASGCIDVVEIYTTGGEMEELRSKDDFDCTFVDGKLVKREKFRVDGANRILSETVEYGYDTEGRLLSSRKEIAGGAITNEAYTYVQLVQKPNAVADPLAAAKRGTSTGTNVFQSLIYGGGAL